MEVRPGAMDVSTKRPVQAPADLRQRRRIVAAVLFSLLVLAVGLLIAGRVFHLRWNRTASLPVGLYRITSQPTPLVEFCVEGPAAQMSIDRGYREASYISCPDRYEPLLKPIAARPGDVVEVSAAGIAVNGHALPNTKQFAVDRMHRSMHPWPPGRYVVEPGTLWVISSYNVYSFDSRYFGPIAEKDILGYAAPVWTAR